MQRPLLGRPLAPGTDYRASTAELVSAPRKAGLTVGYIESGAVGSAAPSLPPVLFTQEAFVSAGAGALDQLIREDMGSEQLAAAALQVEVGYEHPDGQRTVFVSSGSAAEILEGLAAFAAAAAGE